MVEKRKFRKPKKFLTRVYDKPRRREFVYGFDIETKNKNKDFLLGCICNDNMLKFFYNREDMLKFIKDHKGTYIATYLQFDTGMLFPKGIKSGFKPFFRNSDMIGGSFAGSKFLDTMNYAKMGVEKIGKIIGIEKMKKPDFTRIPVNDDEWNYLRSYNHNDALISYKFFRYLEDAALKNNHKLKTTISSSAMDDFRRNDLKGYIKKTPLEDYKKIINAYYGGRCEAFSRGNISRRGYRLYDVRSMYPSVMLEGLYPDPNYMRFRKEGKKRFIEEFEGVTNCVLSAPKMRYPFLPCRIGTKLCFPTGVIEGWYTHVELRKAFKLGYKLLYLKEQYYFSRDCKPFKSFIQRHYNARMKYEKEKNTGMAYFEKISMNGLYGKFGERPEREEAIPKDEITLDMIEKKGLTIGSNADYMFLKRSLSDDETPEHQIPILAIYTTAFGRIKLYDFIVKYEAIYCDTDSIFTRHVIPDLGVLGTLKYEGDILTGIIIKPKMYIIGKVIKVKGFSRANLRQVKNLIRGKAAAFTRFAKFKECQRNNCYYNQPRLIKKYFNCEDDKRIWDSPFDMKSFQDSKPLVVGLAV